MKHRHSPGFTLIELLVVLLLLALAMGLAVPPLMQAAERGRLQHATAQTYDALRRAHSRAVTRNETVILDLRETLKDGRVELSIHPSTDKNPRVIFYPDGSATPAQLVLSHDGERRIIKIDWLTGNAELTE